MASGDRYREPAYRGSEPFAFVSYSHDDSEAVFAELEALSGEGLRLYYDEGIHPGHTWDDQLAEAILGSSVFVYFVSARSAASANCRREVALAVENEKPVIAVYLEDVELPPGLRLSIGNRQAIVRARFDEARYRARLVAAIREHVGVTTANASDARGAPAAPLVARKSRRSWMVAVVAVALVVGAVAAVVSWRNGEAARMARAEQREQQVAKIEQFAEQDLYGAAFALAQPLMAEPESLADARLQTLWKQIVLPGTPIVAEAGATLSYKAYGDADGAWIVAGKTPLEKPLDLPRDVARIRIEKPGFETGEFVVANPGPSVRTVDSPENNFKASFSLQDVPLPLAAVGKLPNGMVLVPPTDVPMFLAGLPDDTGGYDRRPLPEFAIAKFEVTNAEFKEFVDAGGYDDRAYWDGFTFRDEGKTLDWAAARARFVDRTGRPGPADWEMSAYPTGRADYPVGGISWYEAAAYARFRHLSLPTIHHWTRAMLGPYEAVFETGPFVAAASRFLADGPVEARTQVGLGPWGTWNSAGNMREWIWNSIDGKAAALGGAWSDYRDEYQTLVTMRAMDRSPELGLRLMKNLGEQDNELLEPLELPLNEAILNREPMSDEAFSALKSQLTVGVRTPSDVQSTRFAETDLWTADEVTLTYGKNESLSIYLILPRKQRALLQPILFGPPSGGASAPNRNVLEQLRFADVVVHGGRALVIPIWVGLYQRSQPVPNDLAVFANEYRRRAQQFLEDGVRTLDYLATRSDMDMQRVGFLGASLGSLAIGPPLFVQEPRIRTAVLLSCGIWVAPFPIEAPSMDIVNYAPRIRLPVLMINGRYDSVLPHETSQKRLFDLLGTPAADKRHVLFDAGHFTFPHSQLAKEVNDWFDHYLGPVK